MRLLLPIPLLALLAGCAGSRTGASSPPAPSPTAIPTRIIVHVPTHDAKLIGTAVGGVRITVREVTSDRVLATGLHDGSTGDTRRIMETPRVRGERLFTTSDGARFETTVPLSAATMVEITAEGPLGYPDQMARTSKRLTLVPGRDLTGDGLVLELHGYVIDLLTPDSALVAAAGTPGTVRTRVRMLCSCPTGPDALWQVHEVRARLIQGERLLHEVVLPYAGAISEYGAQLPAVPAGRYTLEIIAASPDIATFGVIRRLLTVR